MVLVLHCPKGPKGDLYISCASETELGAISSVSIGCFDGELDSASEGTKGIWKRLQSEGMSVVKIKIEEIS